MNNETGASPIAAPQSDQVAQAQTPHAEPESDSRAVFLALAAWVMPGLGHFLLHRRKKAALFVAVVAALVILGCAMRGDVFTPDWDGPFGALGFVADLGSGAFYVLARAVESTRADLSLAAGGYGTRLIVAAGIVNILAVVDACEIAARAKTRR